MNMRFLYENFLRTITMRTYKAVSISGCGLYGLYCLGACRHLQQNSYMFLLEHFAGTSSGSIISTCMAMKKDLHDVIESAYDFFEYLSSPEHTSVIFQESIPNLLLSFGLVDTTRFFDEIFFRLDIPDITFEDVYNKYKTNLYINSFCLNSAQELQYSRITTPKKRIREAIIESCTVPVLFTPRIGEQYIIDGVFCGKYNPMHLLKGICDSSEILVMHMKPYVHSKSIRVRTISDFISRLTYTLSQCIVNHEGECTDHCLIIQPMFDAESLFTALSCKDKILSLFSQMINHGFAMAKTFSSFRQKNVPSRDKEMSQVTRSRSDTFETMNAKGFMKVQKRNGTLENVSFDKILRRIFKLADPSSDEPHLRPIWTNIDCCKIAQQVIQSVHDNIKTTELDTLAAETAISYSTTHPDYAALAARIEISNLQKSTDANFGSVLDKMYREGLVNDHVMNMYNQHSVKIEDSIDYTRDFLFDYFAIRTLTRSYLTKIDEKIVERPQHMWMRVAIAIHDDIDAALETYEWSSKLYFTHATPTLFNAGTKRQQMSSCFLMNMDDSITNIYKVLSDCAHISKWCGGIGLNISNIRGRDSHIKGTNGKSSGIVPMTRVFNDTARYVNQGGKRLGSFAMYLEPWHVDVFEFLDLKKNVGNEHDRARDLFYALWIPDLFMQRVKEQGTWSFFSPDEAPGLTELHGKDFEERYIKYEQEKRYRKQIPAMELWVKILESQIETGTPYMMYKDACNLKSNQQNLGTIQCSNLCVAPETKILTSQGYKIIGSLEMEESVSVWNGEEWSDTKVVRTNEDSELIRIHFSNGASLDCTEYHHFYRKDGYLFEKVQANALRVGDEMIPCSWNFIPVYGPKTFVGAYTSGYACGLGIKEDRMMKIHENDFIRIVQKLDISYVIRDPDQRDHFQVRLPKNVELHAPLGEYLTKDKLAWLAGLCDSCGHIVHSMGSLHLQLPEEHVNDVFLFLQELGIESHAIGSNSIQVWMAGVQRLIELELPKYICTEIDFQYVHELRGIQPPVLVTSITKTGRRDKTYCFNEPLRHMGVFNGILCGNCSEIVQYTSVEKGEIAVCNLASICLSRFVREDGTFDFTNLQNITRILVRNINHIIDKNFYPIPETRVSNLRHRPMGIGVQGLADLFAILQLPWESVEARRLNQEIFEHMYFAAMDESCLLAEKHGCYESFPGSPASKGILQYHLWNRKPVTDLPWGMLENKVISVGLRNSLLIALMPTASTGQIMGNNECIEPFTSNLYLRRVLSGEFVVINKHLLTYLVEKGLWNEDTRENILRNRGSVQGLSCIPDSVKAVYKTVWEIPQRVLIDMAKDRGAFVCQHQSLNLFVPNTRLNFNVLSAMHMYNWESGNKGSYYLRTQPAAMAVPVTLDPKSLKRHEESHANTICESCSA